MKRYYRRELGVRLLDSAKDVPEEFLKVNDIFKDDQLRKLAYNDAYYNGKDFYLKSDHGLICHETNKPIIPMSSCHNIGFLKGNFEFIISYLKNMKDACEINKIERGNYKYCEIYTDEKDNAVNYPFTIKADEISVNCFENDNFPVNGVNINPEKLIINRFYGDILDLSKFERLNYIYIYQSNIKKIIFGNKVYFRFETSNSDIGTLTNTMNESPNILQFKTIYTKIQDIDFSKNHYLDWIDFSSSLIKNVILPTEFKEDITKKNYYDKGFFNHLYVNIDETNINNMIVNDELYKITASGVGIIGLHNNSGRNINLSTDDNAVFYMDYNTALSLDLVLNNEPGYCEGKLKNPFESLLSLYSYCFVAENTKLIYDKNTETFKIVDKDFVEDKKDDVTKEKCLEDYFVDSETLNDFIAKAKRILGNASIFRRKGKHYVSNDRLKTMDVIKMRVSPDYVPVITNEAEELFSNLSGLRCIYKMKENENVLDVSKFSNFHAIYIELPECKNKTFEISYNTRYNWGYKDDIIIVEKNSYDSTVKITFKPTDSDENYYQSNITVLSKNNINVETTNIKPCDIFTYICTKQNFKVPAINANYYLVSDRINNSINFYGTCHLYDRGKYFDKHIDIIKLNDFINKSVSDSTAELNAQKNTAMENIIFPAVKTIRINNCINTLHVLPSKETIEYEYNNCNNVIMDGYISKHYTKLYSSQTEEEAKETVVFLNESKLNFENGAEEFSSIYTVI